MPKRLPDLPDLLPGEDRSFGSGLFVDLVPRSCWFANARSCLPDREWRRIQKMVRARCGDRCEACDAARDAEAHLWIEVHERWSYDELTGVQKLMRLVGLCSRCHLATHYGLAQIRGYAEDARAQLVKVTGMSSAEVDAHLREGIRVWRQRNRREWALDLSILTDADVEILSPEAAKAKREKATATRMQSNSTFPP
jgi:hypothetical protein